MMSADLLFDARRLIDEIGVAAWGQEFADGSGSALSLTRVLECLREAKRESSPYESYITSPRDEVLRSFLILISKGCTLRSEAAIREMLMKTYKEKIEKLVHEERAILEFLADTPSPRHRMLVYLMFSDIVDPLIKRITAKPQPVETIEEL